MNEKIKTKISQHTNNKLRIGISALLILLVASIGLAGGGGYISEFVRATFGVTLPINMSVTTPVLGATVTGNTVSFGSLRGGQEIEFWTRGTNSSGTDINTYRQVIDLTNLDGTKLTGNEFTGAWFQFNLTRPAPIVTDSVLDNMYYVKDENTLELYSLIGDQNIDHARIYFMNNITLGEKQVPISRAYKEIVPNGTIVSNRIKFSLSPNITGNFVMTTGFVNELTDGLNLEK